MDTTKLYGPPGCGKTHSSLDWLEYQVRQGIEPSEVGFVSFTNAAVDEARRRLGERFGLYEWELPHCGTLHALCKRALGIDGKDWNAENALHEFGRLYGYDLGRKKKSDEDLESVVAQRGQHEAFLAAWNWGRNRLIRDAPSIYAAVSEYDTGYELPYGEFLQFDEDRQEWQDATGRRFFVNVLEEAVERGVCLRVPVVAVDEAQDMSPLLWAACDTLFRHTPVRGCMADDDQAVFSFQGSEPGLFNRREAAQVFQLTQSYRLPARIVELAQSIISRNTQRVSKTILPVTEAIVRRRAEAYDPVAITGEAKRVDGLDELPLVGSGSWFLLVRNWAFVPELTAHLEGVGLPYRVIGDSYYTPWHDRGPLKAARAVLALAEGGKIGVGALSALMEKTRTATKKESGAWVHGAKTEVEKRTAADAEMKVGLMDLPHLGLTEWGFDRIALKDLSILTQISARDLEAYETAQETGHFDSDPWITVSTIHGVKGQESDNVACLECCTAAPERNLEDDERCEEEVRLGYVAVTRARKRVFVVETDMGRPYAVFGL